MCRIMAKKVDGMLFTKIQTVFLYLMVVWYIPYILK